MSPTITAPAVLAWVYASRAAASFHVVTRLSGVPQKRCSAFGDAPGEREIAVLARSRVRSNHLPTSRPRRLATPEKSRCHQVRCEVVTTSVCLSSPPSRWAYPGMRNRDEEVTDARTAERDEVVLEVPEVARRLRVSRSFAYELITTGQLPSLRLGRRVLVPVKMLDEFIVAGGRRP